MRVLGGVCVALASVALGAWLPGELARRPAPRATARAPRDLRLDGAAERLRRIEDRMDAPRPPASDGVRERIAALEARLAEPAPEAPVVEPVPAAYDELVERARVRGFEHWPEVLAEEIATWEAAASRAATAEARVRAWTELERLYSMTGDVERMNLVSLSILETTGLADESAWKRARLLVNREWGYGDIAVASSLFGEIGRSPELPKKVAIGFRMQAAQLAVGGKEPAEALRLYREFIRHYEDDPDPMVMQRVAVMRRGLATLEARHPELNSKEK